MTAMADAPDELRVAISKYWPIGEWENAASIALLESGFNAFALDDTTKKDRPCGTILFKRDGVDVAAERSVGYFQVNSCNFPDWEWQRLYNADHNAGTAHLLWAQAGQSWSPWYFSAKTLGLL
jgi:hypothetical protein